MTRNDTPEIFLSGPQQAAVEALATGAPLQEAAEEAGVSRSTLYRWRKDRSFQLALAEIQAARRAVPAEFWLGLLEEFKGLGEMAADALRDALERGNPATKARAAKIALDYLAKLREMSEFDVRLALLEEEAAEVKRAIADVDILPTDAELVEGLGWLIKAGDPQIQAIIEGEYTVEDEGDGGR